MSITKIIKVGIIGYGMSAKVFHIPFLLALPDLFVITCILARSHPGPTIELPSGQHVKVAHDSASFFQDIDLVVITTPANVHFDHVKLAVAHNKHVIVEKPFVGLSTEATEICKLADQNKHLLFTVYQNRRWDSDFVTLRSIIKKGDLGKLANITSRFDRYRPNPVGWWKEVNIPGNGCLFDIGSHLVDQAVSLFGLPSTLHAIVLNQRNLPVDDFFSIDLDYTPHGGPLVHLTSSALAKTVLPRWVAHGSRGSWTKHGMDVQQSRLVAGQAPDSPDFALDCRLGTLNVDGKAPENIAGEPSTYLEFYVDVARALSSREPSKAVAVSVWQSAMVIRLLELARKSHDEKIVIRIDEEDL